MLIYKYIFGIYPDIIIQIMYIYFWYEILNGVTISNRL